MVSDVKVGMILTGQYPNDIRVERENRLLKRFGHEMYLLCERRETSELDCETIEDVRVERMAQPSGLMGKVVRAIFKITALDLSWYLGIRRFVKSHGLQMLHVHDQPLVLTAALVSRWCGVPVVFDVHDSLPEAMKAWNLAQSFNERLLQSSSRMARLEKKCVRAVDYVVVAIEEYQARFESYGLPKGKIVLFKNVVDHEWMWAQKIDSAIAALLDSKYVILYSGSFGFNRGLDTAIKAMPIVLKSIPNARLVLVGPNSPVTEANQLTALKRLVGGLQLDQHVLFTGRVDLKRVPGYLATSNVCLFPLNRTSHYENALGNKLFEYMAFAKPVVVTDMRAMKELVEDEGCGLVVPPRDPDALAAAIIRLHDNPAMAAEMGKRGRKAVEERYNVRAMSRDFLEMYRRIEREVGDC